MSDEIADFRSAETVPVVEGNTKPSVFVRAVRLRGVQEPMHVRTSTQGMLGSLQHTQDAEPGSRGEERMFVARDVRVGGLRLGHSTVEAGEQRGVATCAVERRFLLAGANPAQQLSLRSPVGSSQGGLRRQRCRLKHSGDEGPRMAAQQPCGPEREVNAEQASKQLTQKPTLRCLGEGRWQIGKRATYAPICICRGSGASTHGR